MLDFDNFVVGSVEYFQFFQWAVLETVQVLKLVRRDV